jgi:hypothetical protein
MGGGTDAAASVSPFLLTDCKFTVKVQRHGYMPVNITSPRQIGSRQRFARSVAKPFAMRATAPWQLRAPPMKLLRSEPSRSSAL